MAQTAANRRFYPFFNFIEFKLKTATIEWNQNRNKNQNANENGVDVRNNCIKSGEVADFFSCKSDKIFYNEIS